MSKWCAWINNGDYTPNGECFDIGRTCLKACRNFTDGIEPTKCGLDSINSNGNGSLMRMIPIALYSYYRNLSNEEMMILSDNIMGVGCLQPPAKYPCRHYTV